MTRPRFVLKLVRAGYGALLLSWPGLVADRLLGHRLGHREQVLARVLGARQLLQALGSGVQPSYSVLALGVEVDLLHAASMLGLGLADRRHRRAAFTDAVIAGTFAVAGTVAARAAPPAQVAPAVTSASGELDALRRRWADRLARLLVPGYPPTRKW